jgi:mannose-6-phosphate isomerase-like protein (cupin superfamily)
MQDSSRFPYQLTDQERQRALDRCLAMIHNWGLTMPDVEPLVLDFGLGKFDEVGEIEFWIANQEEAGYCGKFLFVADGQTCPYHKHDKKHETFFVMKGQVSMVIDGEEKVLRQGEVLMMPPGQHHSFTGVGPALLLEVSMPSKRQDNFFADRAIGEEGVI